MCQPRYPASQHYLCSTTQWEPSRVSQLALAHLYNLILTTASEERGAVRGTSRGGRGAISCNVNPLTPHPQEGYRYGYSYLPPND